MRPACVHVIHSMMRLACVHVMHSMTRLVITRVCTAIACPALQ